MAKEYPSVVSRTLDPKGKSLVTVVGLHDHQLSDADVNLIQDLQDLKRKKLTSDMTTSGCLTYAPFQFDPGLANSFLIPQFDVLFNGEVVTIGGHLSADLTMNKVTLPAPTSWSFGQTADPAKIYIVFLELWYQSLDPNTHEGYLKALTTNEYYYYPYGCVNPDVVSATDENQNGMPEDSIDIFDGGLFTTQRAQIQWRFNVQPVALSYDFKKFHFGIDPGARPTEIVYPQTSNSAPIVDSLYEYHNMGEQFDDNGDPNPLFNGDSGLWAAGDLSNGTINSLNTMDGLSYAMPIAIVFQRNTGVFSLATNPFGTVDGTNPTLSGRYDQKLATQVFADDVVDTRHTVSLDGWDYEQLMKESFVDIINGSSRYAIARGESPGYDARAVGSLLKYYVAMSPTVVANADTIGQWDGFSNGFSSDQRTFYVTKLITVSGLDPKGQPVLGKSVGVANQPWVTGGTQPDAFQVSLPLQSNATITSVVVQTFNTQNKVKAPVTLLEGQIQVSGLNSKTVVVTLSQPLSGTPFEPGSNPMYVTIGVTYPADSGVDLKKVPVSLVGGYALDTASGKTLPVFGISEYAVQAIQPLIQNSNSGVSLLNVTSINPEYSSVVLGTKVWIKYNVAAGVSAGKVVSQTVSGSTTTTFFLDRTGNGYGLYNQGPGSKVYGLYVTRCWDFKTGTFYTITSRVMNGNTCIITIAGAVDPTSTVIFSLLAQDTAQLVYNAPVKAVAEVEETVLFGNYGDTSFTVDKRVFVESLSYDSTSLLTTIVLGANNCIIKGISGDDVNKFMWVKDSAGNFNAVTISSANFNNGLVIITVKGDYSNSQFFFCGSILPAFQTDATLVLQSEYVPYQGEGELTHQYDLLHTDESALITTNGTGKAPIVGLADVYPYNRELPISTMLPTNWSDASLTNIPLATFFDSNYEAMRQNNVEHTFEAPLHTNDFIPPMNKDIHKKLQMLTASGNGRGFTQAIPHVGFAIRPPVPRTVLGQNLQATTAPIVLYVNNLNGKDSNDGLSPLAPKLTITAALGVLPPVLRHPCSIQLIDTNSPYSMTTLKDSLQVIALGDGEIRSSKYYALGNLAFSIQEGGRLVITRAAGTTSRITIDATGFTGFGDGPTSAFFVDNSRVIFNGLQFKGFRDPAIKGIDSDIDFVDCDWQSNVQAGSFEQGCGVILDRGNISLPDGGNGFVLSQSELTVSGTSIGVDTGAQPGTFFIGERQSTINMENHDPASQETGVVAATVVAEAQFNSTIVVASTFQSNGKAVLAANSTLARTVKVTPFAGGVDADDSSTVVTQL